MIIKLLFLVSLFVGLVASGSAHAGSHVLTVRQLPGAEYEAVVTYDNNSFCDPTVNPASSVQVVGFEVKIESPGLDPILCITPTPPIIVFEVTTHIGHLAPGNYTVSWTQPNSFSLSTSLLATGSAFSEVPSTSNWALILLLLGIYLVGARRLYISDNT